MRGTLLATLIYLLVVGGLVCQRYAEGLNSTFDLGIHDQACWLVYHGLNPFMTSRGLQVQADHFSPMAYLLAPLYFFWDDPRTLLLVQTLVLGSGSIPVYLMARRRVKSRGLALLLGCLYLCQPCLMFANFFDFHFTTLLSTPLLWACYGLEANNRRCYYAGLLTALCCSETAPMSMVGLIPLAWYRSGWRRAVLTLVIAGVGLVVSLNSVRWHNSGVATQYTNLYSHFGNTGKEVVGHVLSHPVDTFFYLNTSLNREYLLQIFGPVAFTPLAGPLEFVPALPVLAGNLLSWRASQHSIRYHYMVGILPFLMWAACAGTARLERRFHPRPLGWLLVVACVVGLLVGPLHPEEWPPSPAARAAALRKLQEIIPDGAALAVDNSLGGVLSHRQTAFLFPNPFETAAWGSRRQALVDQSCVGLDPMMPGAWRRSLARRPVDYIISEPGALGGFPFIPPDRAYFLGETCASPDYGLILVENGVAVFAKGQNRRRPPRVLRPQSEWWVQRQHLDEYRPTY